MAGPKIQYVRSSPLKPMTAIIYGPPKVGKTTMAGKFPSPLFIVPKAERGVASLVRVCEELDRDIPYIEVDGLKSGEEAVEYACAKREKEGWRTLVFDPFTTYSTIIEMELRERFKGSTNHYSAYQELAKHLYNLWKMSSDSGYINLWLCHELASGDEESFGGPKVEPKVAGRKFAPLLKANVDLIGYLARIEKVNKKDKTRKVVRRFYVQPSAEVNADFEAGGRWEERFDKPFIKPEWSVLKTKLKGVTLTEE